MLVFGATVNVVPWVWGPEILPLEARSRGVAISVSSHWMWNFCIVMITPVLISRIGWKTYLIFMILLALFVPIVYFCYPETVSLLLRCQHAQLLIAFHSLGCHWKRLTICSCQKTGKFGRLPSPTLKTRSTEARWNITMRRKCEMRHTRGCGGEQSVCDQPARMLRCVCRLGQVSKLGSIDQLSSRPLRETLLTGQAIDCQVPVSLVGRS